MRWGGRPLGFENHPGCRTNENDVPVLPNGIPFKRNVGCGSQVLPFAAQSSTVRSLVILACTGGAWFLSSRVLLWLPA